MSQAETNVDIVRRGYEAFNAAKRNGKTLDVYCCIAFELKDGKITSGREHFYDLYAWDEFWS